MGRENDSFLQMIGLEDEDLGKEQESFVRATDKIEKPHRESFPVFFRTGSKDKSKVKVEQTDSLDDEQTNTELDEPTMAYEEGFDPEQEFTDADYEQEDPTALYEESSTHEMSAEFLREQNDPVAEEEVTEALGVDETSSRTSINSSTAAHELVGELQQDASFEDELLEGLEEAEASRATDIFARSFRADSRKTRAATAGFQEEDFLEDFDESGERALDELVEDQLAEKELPQDLIIEEDSEAPEEAPHVEAEAQVDQYLSYLDDDDEKQIEETEQLFDEASQEEDPYRTQDSVKAFAEEPALEPDAEGTLELPRETMAFRYESESQVELQSASFRLKALEGPVSGEEFSLQSFPLRLGRDPANDISIDDPNISRFHAELHEHNGAIKVIDQGSTNGVKVNGALVQESKLFDHDVIQVGDSIFEFLDAESKTRGIRVDHHGNQTIVQTHAQALKRGKKRNWKRLSKVAALVMMLGVGALYALYQLGTSEQAQQAAVRGAIQAFDLYGRIEREVGIPLNQAEPEEVKRAVIEVIAKIPGVSLTESDFANLDSIHADLFQAILVDDELYAAFEKRPFDFAEKRELVSQKFQRARQAGETREALRWLEILIAMNPDNRALQQEREGLRRANSFVETPAAPRLSQADEEAFARVMGDHRRRVDELVEAGRLEAAIEHSEKVRERIVSLVSKKPEFADFSAGAIAEWKSKENYLSRKLREQQDQRRAERIAYRDGLQKIEELLQTYHLGEYRNALGQIDSFKREHAEHQRLDQVLMVEKQIYEDIRYQYELLEQNVQRNIELENFRLAWTSLYQFLDQLPGHDHAVKLKEKLTESTHFRAQSLYNRARVYEVEAGDLLSAEQAYRRALELSDPRSELTSKIERGYQNIRRKNLQ